MMILVRNVFQAKYGKGGELVALFKEVRQQQPAMSVDRILTDASRRSPFPAAMGSRVDRSHTRSCPLPPGLRSGV